MQHPKKLTAYLNMVKRNKLIMAKILETVIDKICRQGIGCNIEGLGVAYFIKGSSLRDPVGLLLGYVPHHHFGVISDEGQKPLVNKLISQFRFDDTQYSERHKFVELLQRLQDAHDVAWCEFSQVKPDDPMKYFMVQCENIKKEFRL